MQATTRTQLDHDIQDIRDDILRMGSLIEEQIRFAVRSLKDRDLLLAREALEADEKINALRYRVEEEGLKTIARQQPAARDLREIIADIHMAVELERIADHACGIANISLKIGDVPLVKPLVDIPRMSDIVCEMIHGSLDAFLAHDVDGAKRIADRDEEVDALYSQVLRELLTYMMQDATTVGGATYLLWTAHNLERIADRVVNMCERVIFAATGELGDYKPVPIKEV
jgi:phosphate transport system protein